MLCLFGLCGGYIERRTRNEALYGIPIGRLAKIAMALLALGDLKARLWDISWMERNRFWFAVAPIMYAVRRNFHDRNGVLRRRYALRTWMETTRRTTYLVRLSGPQSLRTCR